jgi:hypothetical protein
VENQTELVPRCKGGPRHPAKPYARASPRDGEPDSGGGRDILAVFEIALGLTVVWCRIEESMSAMGARDHTAIAEQLKTEEGCER